jgi:hypothetical protein
LLGSSAEPFVVAPHWAQLCEARVCLVVISCGCVPAAAAAQVQVIMGKTIERNLVSSNPSNSTSLPLMFAHKAAVL